MLKPAILTFCLAAVALAVPAAAEEKKPATPVAAQSPKSAEVSRAEREKRAAEILHQMLGPEIGSAMASKQPMGQFGGDMSRLATENAYEQLWTRPGLSLRDRSMVTIAMLIALGNEHELKIHLQSGLRNGLTPQELEEMIYQATAYVGFPRASDALAVASKVMAEQPRAK